MLPSKTLEQNLDEFLKMLIELVNSGEKEALSEKNQAIMLLKSLPDAYREVNSAIKFDRTSITLEEVISSLKSRDLNMRLDKLNSDDGENHMACGRPQSRSSYSGSQRPRSTSKENSKSSSQYSNPNKEKKCYHIKKECYSWRRKNKDSKVRTSNQSSQYSSNLGDGYDSREVRMVSHDHNASEWILDSECTYHMTPNKAWLSDFKKTEGGNVIMGNN